jgi:hypothetical protein
MKSLIVAVLLFCAGAVCAQDSSNLAITTGVGIINLPGKLGTVLKPSLTFNSGLEYRLKNNWFVQGDVSLNSIGYDQMNAGNTGSFLFKDAGSSLFQLGFSAGHTFGSASSKFTLSLYAGPGYQRFGEPRINVDNVTLIATQHILSSSSLFGRAGSRLSYRTSSPLLQTIYMEIVYFNSPTHVQGYRLQGVSYCLGTKFSLM